MPHYCAVGGGFLYTISKKVSCILCHSRGAGRLRWRITYTNAQARVLGLKTWNKAEFTRVEG